MGVVSAGMCFFARAMRKARPPSRRSTQQVWCARGSRIRGSWAQSGNPRKPVFGTSRGLGELVFATAVRRVQTCRTPTRTATKRRVRPGRAMYSIAWTAEHSLQHRLRKGIWRGLLAGTKSTSPRSGVPMRRAHLWLIKYKATLPQHSSPSSPGARMSPRSQVRGPNLKVRRGLSSEPPGIR